MKYTMTSLFRTGLTAAALSFALLPAHAQDKAEGHDHKNHDHAKHGHHHHGKHQAFASVKELVAVLTPTEGNSAKGTLTFTKAEKGGVKITAKVTGLKPNSKHAIHIHEFGDIRGADGKMTGGHYNPEGHDHALPDKDVRHAGDLGNLEANAEGVAEMVLVVDNVSLVGHKNPIVGRAIIVHAGEDDGGQPTGNAGARITQGVIGIAKH